MVLGIFLPTSNSTMMMQISYDVVAENIYGALTMSLELFESSTTIRDRRYYDYPHFTDAES